MDELQKTLHHDERIYHEGEAIFNEDDLRELINYMYSEYQYKGSQLDKLVRLINFLASESNRYINPDLAKESQRLSAFLDTFWEFLKSNFHPGPPEDGDTIYLFNTEETSSETEAFLIEFQIVSMDTEKAYRKYRAADINQLQIQK